MEQARARGPGRDPKGRPDRWAGRAGRPRDRTLQVATGWPARPDPGPCRACRADRATGTGGSAGSRGPGDLAALDGTACTRFDSGNAGTVDVVMTAANVVELRCDGAWASAPPPPPSGSVVINEIDYDQVRGRCERLRGDREHGQLYRRPRRDLARSREGR